MLTIDVDHPILVVPKYEPHQVRKECEARHPCIKRYRNAVWNGLAESSNKNLIQIINRIVGENKRAWDNSLKYALWADRVMKKQLTDEEALHGQFDDLVQLKEDR
jgi:hypothetical protein